ncbi:hypothetical protein FGO68_gene15356 [Halteria grandinella]|uniref:Uncharacterized protein n=1 Tax=Halteria grandinella TaxID=5974 RepID=A0A8J8P487_HALGN|nr:hypothetical protein FGO68_gene15356 [Halteria grandinella]
MILSLISLPMPGLAQLLQSAILNLIQLDILFTDKWLPRLIYGDDRTQSEPLNDFFESNGYESVRLVDNMGSSVVYLWMLFSAYGVYIILSIFSNRVKVERLATLKRQLYPKMFWQWPIRFLLQQFAPLLTAVLIQTTNLSVNTNPEKFDSLACVTILIILCGIIIFLYNISKDDTETISTLYEGVRKESRISGLWNLIVMARWTVTLVVMVYLRELPQIQISLVYLLSIIDQILLLEFNPLEANKVAFFNELMVSLYLYVMMTLCDDQSNQRENIGIVLMGIDGTLALKLKRKFKSREQRRLRQGISRRLLDSNQDHVLWIS